MSSSLKYFLLIVCFLLTSCGKSNPTTQSAEVSGACSCTGKDLDCGDFHSKAQAQRCYEHCKRLGYGDKHNLDFDNDGKACERLK